jgi:hypothetical protein
MSTASNAAVARPGKSAKEVQLEVASLAQLVKLLASRTWGWFVMRRRKIQTMVVGGATQPGITRMIKVGCTDHSTTDKPQHEHLAVLQSTLGSL